MKKIYPFICVLASLSLYAQDSQQEFAGGDQGLNKNATPSYNFPARVQLRASHNLTATVSYLYWCAEEGGLDLATTAEYDVASNTVIPLSPKSKTVFQDFDYSSGFKLGLAYAIHEDDWILRADYTYFYQDTHKSKSAPATSSGVGALYFTNWFYQVSGGGQGGATSHLSSKWRLEIDWLDVVLERPYYSGRKFTLSPFMGLRASWIDQSLHIRAGSMLNVAPPTDQIASRNKSESWGIGPRFGIDGRFLFCDGWRIQGEVGGSILYTQYTKVTHSEDPFIVGGSGVAYAFHNYDSLQPIAEANLGLGWGKYFSKQRYHLDLSATYDFNYLWSQNMLRVLNDLNIEGTNGSGNDLYLYGLTLTASFSF